MSATKNPRLYNGSDVNMLTAADTIIAQAIANGAFLIPKRTSWADPFFPDIQTRISNAFQNFLGVDSAKEMREATQLLITIQKQALPLLAEFKVQIDVDFKNPRRTEILTQLGFTTNLKAAQKQDQEALIQLLYQFKKNMTVSLKNEITTLGTAAATIDNISAFADTLKNSNISQEALKGGRKTITAAGITEFNAIYDSIIGICKIAAKFYVGAKDMQDIFSYNKTVGKLTAAKKAPTPPPAAAPK